MKLTYSSSFSGATVFRKSFKAHADVVLIMKIKGRLCKILRAEAYEQQTKLAQLNNKEQIVR